MKNLDLTNQVFHKLTVISFSHVDKFRQKRWLCKCECGNTKAVKSAGLLSGETKSCGCLSKEILHANGVRTGRKMKDRLQAQLANGTRKCSDCQTEKPLEAFPKNKKNPSGYHNLCRDCQSVRVRDYKLKTKFNMTEEEYQVIFQHQDGVCAVCGNPPKKSKLSIDHRHKDGLLRGLLCWVCNNAMGSFRENVSRMEAAIAYLKQSPENFPISKALGSPRYGIRGRVSNKAETVRKLNKPTQKETP